MSRSTASGRYAWAVARALMPSSATFTSKPSSASMSVRRLAASALSSTTRRRLGATAEPARGEPGAPIADADPDEVSFAAGRDGDGASPLAVLGGVVQQIRHGLCQAIGVTGDQHALARHLDHHLVGAPLEERADRLDGARHDGGELGRLSLELNLPW